MLQRSSTNDSGLDKLQAVLLRMAPGDELRVEHAVRLSGLDQQTCLFVLEALTAAGLMIETADQTYIRCRLRVAQH